MSNTHPKRMTWIVLTFAFFLFIIVIVSGLFLSSGVMDWAKESAKLFIKTVHPFEKIRKVESTAKSILIKPDPLSLAALSPPPFPGTQTEQSQGITSWIDPTSDRIPPTEVPTFNSVQKAGTSLPIRLSGFKGETASFQLVLRSEKPVTDLHVSIHPDQSDPNISCISIHRFYEWYEPIAKKTTPDPLIPFHDPYDPQRVIVRKIDLKSSTDQPIWVDVHLSRSCPAHTFHANLLIKNQTGLIRTTSITITVLNATLPKNIKFDRWMQLYVSRFWRGESIPNDTEYKKLFYRYVKLGHEYGFATNDVDSIAVPNINFDWNTGKVIATDWSHYDDLMGPILSGQVTGSSPNAWALPVRTGMLGMGTWGGFSIHSGISSPISKWKGIPDTAAQGLAKAITEHWKEKGWPLKNAFVFAFDEPEHQLYYPDVYKLIATVADSIHKGSNNQLRFMVTDTPYAWDRKQLAYDKSVMKGKIDIWAPGATVFMPDRMAKLQEAGAETWFYQTGPPFIGASDLYSTGVGFRMWFWAAWKYHTNGIFYWAANFWPDNTLAVNPYTNPGTGDGIVFYPGHQLHLIGFPDIDGPVPSIRMAQWRRGYEDYQYFVMLKQKGHGKEVDELVNKLVHKALNDGDYFPYWRNPLWQKPGAWSHDPTDWHKARVEMSQKIEFLYNGNSGKN